MHFIKKHQHDKDSFDKLYTCTPVNTRALLYVCLSSLITLLLFPVISAEKRRAESALPNFVALILQQQRTCATMGGTPASLDALYAPLS